MSQTACHHCDQLIDVRPLNDGEQALCPRCGGVLTSHRADGFARAAAYAVAALVLLVPALQFPFLGFSAGGQAQSMTLIVSSTALMDAGEHALGALVIGFIIAAPLLMLITLLVLVAAIRTGKRWRRLPTLGKLFMEINHWNMVEVFIIGVLVSLTKIAAMAHIVLGLSFWAFIGFGLCLVLATNAIDRHDLWRSIASLAGRQVP